MTPTTKPADAKGAVDVKAAVDRLMRFLAVEGVTGQEKAIAAEVADALHEAGVPAVGDPLRHGQRAHPAADADRQPDRRRCPARGPARGCCS